MSFDIERFGPQESLQSKVVDWLESARALTEEDREVRGFAPTIQAAEVIMRMMPEAITELAFFAEARLEIVEAGGEDILKSQIKVLPNALAHILDGMP